MRSFIALLLMASSLAAPAAARAGGCVDITTSVDPNGRVHVAHTDKPAAEEPAPIRAGSLGKQHRQHDVTIARARSDSGNTRRSGHVDSSCAG